MKERIRRMMYGRYGNDQLNQFIVVVAMIFLVLEIITHQQLFWFAALICLILTYIRMFSKNIRRRHQENTIFLNKKDAFLNKFRKQKYYAAQRKDYHIYTCPECSQKIRIPRGKGKIRVTCPKCKASFVKKS